MSDEREIPWGKIAAGVGTAVGIAAAGIGSYSANRSSGSSVEPTFSMQERLELERRIGVMESKVERFDAIVAGGREEMSQAARKRIESSEADISVLERRVRELEERVNKIERRIP